ncbi:hypothetical protein PTSG_00531 [Salpingoeca rosetta]|uniref:Uncharacterized protein n=1 Tax=Salpingoeca rosetta (strain ATCC 50818 / BSB-021) TaxID=946362 RepID=F2TWQ8_SALR5|nr:uncharacterized protein PTSG_00531 [Salpingoeca rosetta]EGD72504.1 hypothetical protein PTSG_00531 [Salpingoeca rosetta]|eukprot:XP_004999073.1 hypothetical protein PTSG_00531 [Salpingoeca rosetta]
MTSYVKHQIAKKLASYFKDMTADKLALSVLKGTAVLHDLELQEGFLRSALLLPPWLYVTKASCNRADCKLSITRLKTHPMTIDIDRINIIIEAVDPEDHARHYQPTSGDGQHAGGPHDPHASAEATSAHHGKPEKYGVGDTVVDGVTVNVNLVEVHVHTPDFSAKCLLQGLQAESVNRNWEPVTDLRHAQDIDPTKQYVTLFKKLVLGTVSVSLTSSSLKLPEASRHTEVGVVLQESEIRISRRRSLLDNTVVLGVQVNIMPGVIKLELSREELQTLQVVLHSITQLADAYSRYNPATAAAGRESALSAMPSPAASTQPQPPPAAGRPRASTMKHSPVTSRRRTSSVASTHSSTGATVAATPPQAQSQQQQRQQLRHTLHPLYTLAIQHIHISILQPAPALASRPLPAGKDRARGRTLVTLIAQELELRHISGLRWRGSDKVGPAKEPFDHAFNARRDTWLRNLGYTSDVMGERQLHISMTRVALRALSVISDAGHPIRRNGGDNNAARGGRGPAADADDEQETTILMQPRYDEKNVPSYLLLLEHQAYDVPIGASSSPAPPPPVLFARLSPIKVQVNLAAIMHIAHFAQHTILRGLNGFFGLAAAAILEDIEAATSEQELAKVSSHISAASDLDKLEIVQLRAACTRRAKAIRVHMSGQLHKSSDNPVEQTQQQQQFSGPLLKFRGDLMAPAIEIPPLASGPAHIRHRTWLLRADALAFSNTSHWTENIGPASFRSMFLSPFFNAAPRHTHASSASHDERSSGCSGSAGPWQPTDVYSVLPPPQLMRTSRATFVSVRAVTLRSFGHPDGPLLSTVVEAPHVAAALVALPDAPAPAHNGGSQETEPQTTGQGGKGAPSADDTAAFALISVPERVGACLDDEEMLFMTRLLEEFQRHSSFFDSGLPAPRISCAAVQVPTIDVDLRVRAPPEMHLQLHVGGLLAADAGPRQPLHLCHATVVGTELARHTFSRAACLVGSVQRVCAHMSHLPQPQHTKSNTGDACDDGREKGKPGKPQVWFRFVDTLPTPQEADAFFAAWDQRQAMMHALRAAVSEAADDRDDTMRRSRSDSMAARKQPTTVERDFVEEDDAEELHERQQGVRTSDPHCATTPRQATKHVAVQSTQQQQQQQQQSLAAVLVNGPGEEQETAALTPEVGRDGGEARGLSSAARHDETTPLRNSWARMSNGSMDARQAQLEVMQVQNRLEDVASSGAEMLERSSGSQAMHFHQQEQPLPPLGSSSQHFFVSNLSIDMASDHGQLLGRYADDFQEALPAASRRFELENVRVNLVDSTEHSTLLDSLTRVTAPSQLVEMLQVGCSGLCVDVAQDASTGATRIQAGVRRPEAETCDVAPDKSRNPSSCTEQRDDSSVSYLEDCLKEVVKEKCHLQQALEDLSSELVRLKQENVALRQRMRSLAKPR